VLSLTAAVAQNRTVSGVVSATSGESVIGAGVLVDGTTKGVTTDLDGRYSIEVPGDAVLVVSSIGYKTVKVKVNDRTVVNITLENDSQLLEEAVAVGYGNQSKLTLTGSVAQTTGRELTKSSSVNLSQGLAGRMPGVIVNNRTGEPGKDDATMYIRGRSTLGSNTPLIIIDGVPGRDGEFSRLTGEEIESINVLKDASAAIYGARSANGVILVTTKRGKYGEAPRVTFSYDLGLQQPTKTVKMADAVLYAEAYNAARANTGASAIYNDAQIEHFRSGDDPIMYPNVDWYDMIIKPLSAQHKYGVSINGGSDRVAYFVQFNGQYQDGIYHKSATNYSQYNVRSNIDIQVTKGLKLGIDLNARQQHKNYSAYGASGDGGVFYMAQRRLPTSQPFYPDYPYERYTGGNNPVVWVQDVTGYDKTTLNTIDVTFSANWNLDWITKGLSVNGKMAYDVAQSFNKNWRQNWKYWQYDEITETYTEKTSADVPTPNLYESQNNCHTTTINANINYDRDFGGHHVTALAGFEQSHFRRDRFNATIDKYDSDILDEFFAGTADKSYYDIGGSATETARRSFFGRLGYDYKSKYMIQGLIRFDGSENFPKENRWGVFPGVSVGWRLSEESFIKDNAPILTNLKIRASYGEQGNDAVSAFQYMTTYQYSDAIRYSMEIDGKKVNAIIPGTIPNPGITWEVAKTWNVGVDGNIDNGMFGWEVEAFHTRRSNILCSRSGSVPFYTGLTGSLPAENIGIVSNRGIELQLSHENRVANGEFMYQVTGNFMFVRNRIEYMDEAPYGEKYKYMEQTGHPMGSSLIYQVKGINKTVEDLEKYPQMDGARLGDFIFEDLDKDGKITTFDRKRCDLTVVPEIVFGMNFTAQYKGFDFTMLLQGQGRARFYYAPSMDPQSDNLEYYAAKYAWSVDNPDSDYPRLLSTITNGGTTRSSFYYRNASFLRLKNVELGYTIPQKAFGKVPVRGLRIYIAGYNLFTISQLKEVDPEASSDVSYPQMRIYNAGVKLSF
jgi:TonB-linked SusC/RagA family outer membrane protein